MGNETKEALYAAGDILIVAAVLVGFAVVAYLILG